uniref:Transmembrane and coiled-coil domain-containing protein 4 isoform X3 n=1 Tax=Elaeis guineensis var. tenera TaxID=51953 RepID=A0A8N4IG55_ELAGV|nr:transmembrane and coiled-coil domain-containing protein 4 isoform X3 [Elaeis guineensis]
MMAFSTLSPTQRYAAGALLALALRQAQIHQTQPLDDDDPDAGSRDRCSSASASSSTSSSEGDGDSCHLWTHESRGLLRPVFRFLDIDPKAWPGLEETAASSIIKHHVGAYLRIIFEEDDEKSSERFEKELALAKAVDAMVMSLEASLTSAEESKEKDHKHERDSHKRSNSGTLYSASFGATRKPFDTSETKNSKGSFREEDSLVQFENVYDDKTMLEDNSVKYQQKVAVLYELLSACVADTPQDNKKTSRVRKGYDARHRVALRLLATWLDVKWIKMVAMEIMVACSAMAAAKADEQSQESQSEKSKWARWKRGGIIGAAALTGGALLAITGAAGAGLSGSKMARRTGSVEEFEFKPIGDNHNQGRLAVGILVTGFAFEKEDFIKPWEGLEDNLERYVLQWESKYIIAVSTAIQDWITSSVTMGLMKQGAMLTVLSTLVSALAWPATLLAATDFIDSKWTMAIDRSDKAGKLLAEVLSKGLQGNRPVTLIGFSLGARVIFRCLRKLAESGDNEGLVERVVLLGAPVSVKGEQWEIARKIVAGRFVNVYSTNDWILGVTFRARYVCLSFWRFSSMLSRNLQFLSCSLLTQGLAGIQAVDVPGIENVDVTDFIDGHSSYLSGVQQILEQLELDTYYPVFSCIPISSR